MQTLGKKLSAIMSFLLLVLFEGVFAGRLASILENIKASAALARCGQSTLTIDAFLAHLPDPILTIFILTILATSINGVFLQKRNPKHDATLFILFFIGFIGTFFIAYTIHSFFGSFDLWGSAVSCRPNI